MDRLAIKETFLPIGWPGGDSDGIGDPLFEMGRGFHSTIPGRVKIMKGRDFKAAFGKMTIESEGRLDPAPLHDFKTEAVG